MIDSALQLSTLWLVIVFSWLFDELVTITSLVHTGLRLLLNRSTLSGQFVGLAIGGLLSLFRARARVTTRLVNAFINALYFCYPTG